VKESSSSFLKFSTLKFEVYEKFFKLLVKVLEKLVFKFLKVFACIT